MDGRSLRITVIKLKFRIFHIVLMIGSAYLLYSGLGADDHGGVFSMVPMNLYMLHRYVGIAWGIVVAAYAYAATRKSMRIRILDPIRKPMGQQIAEGLSVVGKYLLGRNMPEHVRRGMGRHNVMASYAFLLMAGGIILLGVSGLFLLTMSRGNIIYEAFLALHVLGTGMLALFVLMHLGAVFNRHNRPLLKAVFSDGKVNREWAEHTMPLHLAEEE